MNIDHAIYRITEREAIRNRRDARRPATLTLSEADIDNVLASGPSWAKSRSLF